ncbi:MAG: hypothetical protein SF182_12715 [Deltaproteobacteria bacterium]|nr:hypothetical protein [Deltaproteobacteria bacterium]
MSPLTSAQIHLAVNHLPVVTALLALPLLLFGLTGRAAATRFGLGLLIVAALAAVPASLSGEGAEEVIESYPGVSERLIERHEDAAELALTATLISGAIAAAAVVAQWKAVPLAVALARLALVAALASSVLLGRAAHLGGQIRHQEIRADAGAMPPARHAD